MIPAILLTTLSVAGAHGTGAPARVEPQRLTAGQLPYTSSFRAAPLGSLDVQAIPWKTANETVRALGGHAGMLRAKPGARP